MCCYNIYLLYTYHKIFVKGIAVYCIRYFLRDLSLFKGWKLSIPKIF